MGKLRQGKRSAASELTQQKRISITSRQLFQPLSSRQHCLRSPGPPGPRGVWVTAPAGPQSMRGPHKGEPVARLRLRSSSALPTAVIAGPDLPQQRGRCRGGVRQRDQPPTPTTHPATESTGPLSSASPAAGGRCGVTPLPPPQAVETPEEACPGAGIPGCSGNGDTRRSAWGTVAVPCAAAAAFVLGESQGRTGVGEQRDSARLRNSYFSRCLDKPVASDTSARSGQALRSRQGGTWQAAKPTLELPRRQADRQRGLGGRSPRAALPERVDV